MDGWMLYQRISLDCITNENRKFWMNGSAQYYYDTYWNYVAAGTDRQSSHSRFAMSIHNTTFGIANSLISLPHIIFF